MTAALCTSSIEPPSSRCRNRVIVSKITCQTNRGPEPIDMAAHLQYRQQDDFDR